MVNSHKLLWRILNVCFGTAGKQRLSILIYHRVLDGPDVMRPFEPTSDSFACQMQLIAGSMAPLSLSDALELMKVGRLPERAVCVTFDDGYADNYTTALPVLQKYGVPATVFVATGFLNGGRMWNDTVIESVRSAQGKDIDLGEFGLPRYELDTSVDRRVLAEDILGKIKHLPGSQRDEIVAYLVELGYDLPADLMLSTEQLLGLRDAGIEIGAHTHSHPIMANLSLSDAREEVERSRSELQRLTSSPVRFFAYPNGRPNQDYLPAQRNMVEEMGFEAAVSTHWGVSDKSTDRWQLPRFTPWDRSRMKFAMRMALNARTVH